jgi:hypothetical protein
MAARGTYTVTVSGYGPDATFATKSQPATISTAGQALTVNFTATLTGRSVGWSSGTAYRWTAAPGDRVGIYWFRLARTP